MVRYLVVAHQTATSPTLVSRAQHLASLDPGATFTLLVPATHPMHLLAREGALFTWDEVEAERIARARSVEARERFERAGLQVAGSLIGDASPLLAIEDELRRSADAYDQIILSTFPPGSSRWLGMDVQRDAERLGMPVIHVYEGLTDVSVEALLRQQPLTTKVAHVFAPLARVLERPHPSTAAIVAVMAIYIALATSLALFVNRRFVLNDVVALLVFAGLLGALAILEPTLANRVPATTPGGGRAKRLHMTSRHHR